MVSGLIQKVMLADMTTQMDGLPADRLRYGGNLMLKHEYIPFQYVVVYIAVLQVSPEYYVRPLRNVRLTHGPNRVAWVLDSG